ncbi:MAG: hypothetical protein MUF39_06155 [Cyclobacteriaceae bacterium]|jgi:hypothetical protein|nr:hypothetical protein [Cyclobacteriaceae bacterium]
MIKALIILLFPLCLLVQDVPYKASDEYEITIDYKFEERPAIDRTRVDYSEATDERNRKAISGPLPYLKINIKLLKLSSEELKLRMTDSNGRLLFSRKATVGTMLTLDIGFIDDVKDQITPNNYTLTIFSDSKKPVSRIYMEILEDGTFLVNAEKRGKF